MAQYTPNQLSGPGILSAALSGNQTFTFTNTSGGSTYFTLETSRNDRGVYDITSPTNTIGIYSNFVGMNEEYLVASPYISSVVVPPGSSSFQFNPTVNITSNSLYLRATGPTTLDIT